MNSLKHTLFISAAILTTANEIIERSGYSIPYLNSYLDDLACFPVVLTIGLAFLRWMQRSRSYVLSKAQVVLAVIYFSVVFEGILPAVSENYTRDPLDVIAYSAGAFLFWRYINRNTAEKLIVQHA